MVAHPSPDPESQNVLVFSDKIATAIREALSARALHPASVIGVLAYHQGALASSTQHAFLPPPKQPMGLSPIFSPPGLK